MGIRFTIPINPGSHLKIAYVSRDFEVSLPAILRWCRDKTPNQHGAGESYQLGIEFESANINDNMLMFMAIRKFLDHFTSARADPAFRFHRSDDHTMRHGTVVRVYCTKPSLRATQSKTTVP